MEEEHNSYEYTSKEYDDLVQELRETLEAKAQENRLLRFEISCLRRELARYKGVPPVYKQKGKTLHV